MDLKYLNGSSSNGAKACLLTLGAY
uniref:Uncharacterized protein n=1 Tax=Rhizophora mucronata TaxID=61149 RepID=A0A2P2Q5Q9_RHIMU